MKQCTKCGLEKPLEAFPRDRTKPDGRYPRCSVCHSKPVDQDKVDLAAQGLKRCCECRVWKGLGSFHRSSQEPDGRYRRCKACRNSKTWADRELLKAQEMKQCSKCKEVKPLTRFTIRASGNAVSECLSCAALRHRAYNERIGKRALVLRKHGLTLDDYDAMLKAQNGRCALCRRFPKRKVLSIDHDHYTGKVRGLLCDACNWSLGNLGDTEESILRVLQYLRLGSPAMGVPEQMVLFAQAE